MNPRTTALLVALAFALALTILTAAIIADAPQRGPCDGVKHWACEELNG